MRRILAALALAFTLTGCATIQKVANVAACAPGVWNATLL